MCISVALRWVWVPAEVVSFFFPDFPYWTFTTVLPSQAQQAIRPKYMDGYEINERMRALLIDWLIQVHSRFQLLQETLYMTVAILDRFLQVKLVEVVAHIFELLPDIKFCLHRSNQCLEGNCSWWESLQCCSPQSMKKCTSQRLETLPTSQTTPSQNPRFVRWRCWFSESWTLSLAAHCPFTSSGGLQKLEM